MGKLEQAYPKEIAVIGVSSPKYPAEAVTGNLRHAVQRLDIAHPVVNDAEMQIWDAYGVNAWPTLIFISPRGEVIGHHAGEVRFESLDEAMRQVIAQYDEAGTLSHEPVHLPATPHRRPLDTLSYPGKVLATPSGIFIADTDHHRIIHASPSGEVQKIIGGPEPGFSDGPPGRARFHRPQGMSLDPITGTLYVADEENHAVRAIEDDEGLVRTVAGTGSQALRVQRRGPALDTPLSSPFDLALDGSLLYIAMAGVHQIWRLNIPGGVIEVYAGTGHEGLRDGPALQSWFAQPMGLDLNDGALWIACAEAQSVRRVALDGDAVDTVVGQGLFAFGDENGQLDETLLQHNQGVASGGHVVFVADTYNNQIKQIDLRTQRTTTLAGSGVTGDLDGPAPGARFNAPSGLSFLNGTLYVADTNNHCVRTIELASGHVRTVRLTGFQALLTES